jgi:membrane-associated HD superfamily phosphohydrolase
MSDSPDRDSRVWQLITLILPILLTSWLTYFVSQKQSRTEDRINYQSQMLSQQLQQQVQVSEDLLKRRFDAYDKLYAQLVEIQTKLEHAEAGEANKIVADQAFELGELLDASGLHMSEKVSDLAFQTWLATSYGERDAIDACIKHLKAGMKNEINVQTESPKASVTEDSAQPKTSGKPSKSKGKTGGSQ